jgi:hypothetical protein
VLLLDKISNLSSISSYEIDNTDILCSRRKTIGRARCSIQFKNINLNVIDAGGQRSERFVR